MKQSQPILVNCQTSFSNYTWSFLPWMKVV